MSLKRNFVYNSILTVSTYFFPLLVYPYVSRTLGLSNIGIVNFIDNFINYFVLFSTMGIMTVGVREIAVAKNDRENLSRTYISLLTLTTITTLIAIIALWIAMYSVPTLFPYRDLLYVGIVKLVFNLFLVEWFFMGMENFKYITNRSILVKCLYVAGVFLFVKDASDYKIYYMLSVATVVVNAVINIIYSRKFVSYSLKSIDFQPFLRAFFIMGIYVLFTNVYTSLNVVWLGFVTDTDQVGYFTTATKLHTIIMAVLLSFTNILFPRVSNLLAERKEGEYWEKIDMSFEAIFLFAFPTIFFLLVAGPLLLHLFVGDGFEGSYLPLRIITLLVLIIGIEQILVIQILMAKHQDKIVLRNSLMGAIVALLFNLVLTANLGAVGSAVVWVVAEFFIMLVSMTVIYRKFHYTMPYKKMVVCTISYLPLLLLSLLICHFVNDEIVLLVILAIFTFVYAAFNEIFILKNKVARQLLQYIHLTNS